MSPYLRRRANDSSEPAVEFDTDNRTPTSNISYGDDEFYCNIVRSQNGEWTAAYGRSSDGDQRLFILNGTDIVVAHPVERPDSCVVSNDGTAALIDAETMDTIGGSLHVVTADGDVLVHDRFDANVSSVSISPDGACVGITTLKPDRTAYLYDRRDDMNRTTAALEHGNYHASTLEREKSEWILYVSRGESDDPLCAINVDGEFVWKSEYMTDRESLIKRVLSVFRS